MVVVQNNLRTHFLKAANVGIMTSVGQWKTPHSTLLTPHYLRESALTDKGVCASLGLFDGVHIGHRAIISAANEYADKNNLTSAVITFAQPPCVIPGKSGQGALTTLEQRMELYRQLGTSVCFTLNFEEIMNLTPEEFVRDILVEKLNVRTVFCGFNYRFGKGAAGDTAELKRLCGEHGTSVYVVQPVRSGAEVVSSARIRALINAGDVKAANELLCRPFEVKLPVCEGRHNGRKVGIPTINQIPPKSFVSPRHGVYASYTIIDGARHRSVTNVGVRPTVGGESENYETNILDGYSGELYGQTVRVQLIDFVRDERRFSSLEQLSEQIRRDIAYIDDNNILSDAQ